MAAYAKTNAISRACEAAYRNALAILAVATLRGGNELRLLIYAVRVCRLPSLFSIMFLDTLYSKKWYDMPHIGCGIHSLQRSTISRIGRHSAGYNIGMRVVLYLYNNSPYGLCGAYLWSLQTEFWADRFAKCLKMFPLTYFLYCKVLAL